MAKGGGWHVDEFLSSLTALAPATVDAYRADLDRFLTWTDRAGCEGPGAVDRRTIRRYLAYLTSCGFAPRSVARKASSLRRYFHWLVRSGLVPVDPTEGLSAPKGDSRLPHVLTREEVRHLLPSEVAPTPPAADEPRELALRRPRRRRAGGALRQRPACRRAVWPPPCRRRSRALPPHGVGQGLQAARRSRSASPPATPSPPGSATPGPSSVVLARPAPDPEELVPEAPSSSTAVAMRSRRVTSGASSTGDP